MRRQHQRLRAARGRAEADELVDHRRRHFRARMGREDDAHGEVADMGGDRHFAGDLAHRHNLRPVQDFFDLRRLGPGGPLDNRLTVRPESAKARSA